MAGPATRLASGVRGWSEEHGLMALVLVEFGLLLLLGRKGRGGAD